MGKKSKLKVSLLKEQHLKMVAELEKDIDYLLSCIENPYYCKSRIAEIKLGKEFQKSVEKDIERYLLLGQRIK